MAGCRPRAVEVPLRCPACGASCRVQPPAIRQRELAGMQTATCLAAGSTLTGRPTSGRGRPEDKRAGVGVPGRHRPTCPPHPRPARPCLAAPGRTGKAMP